MGVAKATNSTTQEASDLSPLPSLLSITSFIYDTPTRYHLNNDIISPEGYYAIQRLDMGVTMTATRENGYVSPTAIATPKNSPTPSVTYLTEDCIWPSDYPPVSKSTLSTTQTTRVASSGIRSVGLLNSFTFTLILTILSTLFLI
ncbi:hypothetical protein BDV3_002725 [Batrachochytrium dendrobatidis]